MSKENDTQAAFNLALGRAIKAAAVERGKNLEDVGAAAGIAKTTIYARIKSPKGLDVGSMLAIADELDMSLMELIKRAVAIAEHSGADMSRIRL